MTLAALVGRVLRIGLAVSVAFIVPGVLAAELSGQDRRGSLTDNSFPHGLSAVAHAAAVGSGAALIEIGLAVLLSVPLAAVAAAAVAWHRRGDLKMAAVGAGVVGILVLSAVLAVLGP